MYMRVITNFLLNNIKLSGHTLEIVKSEKLLLVIIDQNLN